MRARLAAAITVSGLAAAGCLPAPEHRCAGDGDCAGGVCVSPPSACAFPDDGCAGGLRFGAGAGGLADTCVPAIDAGVDAPAIDAPLGPDEDGDGIPDERDNCPHIANPLQEDVGELAAGAPDGVGDACDPEPARPGDAIILFEGFNAPLTGWTTSGSITIDGGRARFAGGAELSTMGAAPRHVLVMIGGRATGILQPVGLTLSAAIATTGTGLGVGQTAVTNPRLRLTYNGGIVNDTVSEAITGQDRFTLALLASRTSWNGVLTVDGGMPISVRRSPMQALTNGRISVDGAGLAPFELDYLVVIELAEQ